MVHYSEKRNTDWFDQSGLTRPVTGSNLPKQLGEHASAWLPTFYK